MNVAFSYFKPLLKAPILNQVQRAVPYSIE